MKAMKNVVIKSVVLSFCVSSVICGARWVSWNSKRQGVPRDAIIAGSDADGRNLYIIRAPTDRGVLPGKYNSASNFAYVPWGNKEHKVTSFDVS